MPILGILASSKLTAADGDYESIATVTVGSGGAAEIDFQSIPSTYTHLQIRWIARHASNSPWQESTLFLRANNDTSSTYWNHFLLGDGSSASAGNQSNTGYANMGQVVANDATASIFGAGVLDILDYANTNKNKTFRHLLGYDRNGGGKVQLFSGSWSSTTAINRLTFIPATSPFQQHTHFALYGIKSA